MTIVAPHALRPGLIDRLQAAFTRRPRSAATRPGLAIGPDIPRIADRDAPTRRNDQPFFLQPGFGRTDPPSRID